MNIFKTVLVTACVSIVISSSAEGQKLDVNFDYATFRYDSAKTYIELYYSFNGRAAHLIKKDSSFAGLLLFEAVIKSSNADTIVNRQWWKVPMNVADTSADYLNHSLVGEFADALVPGKYNLFVNVADQNDTTNIDTVREIIDVPKYLSDKLCMSDVELCSSISSDETNKQSTFYKNTYDVVPNPSGVFGVGLPIVYYYFEVYDIAQKTDDSSFTVGYQVRDSFGDVHKDYSKRRKKFGNSSVEVGTVNASNLKTGAYTIIFTVTDSTANLVSTSSKRFFVYNPSLGSPAMPSSNFAGGAILSSAFAALGEQQLDNEFEEAKYIAISSEMDQYKQLHGVEAKRQFMYEFWEKRNTGQVSAANDQRSDYLQRVAYANDHFRSGAKDGWKTDRGRVYVMYGNPDRDRQISERDRFETLRSMVLQFARRRRHF